MRRSLLILTLSTGLAGAAARAEGPGTSAGVESAVQAALLAAATVPNARVEILSVEPARPSCGAGAQTQVEVSRPVDGSARVAVKLLGTVAGGHSCEVWAWVRFRLFAKVPVTLRAVRAGESLGGATSLEEREMKMGHEPAVLADGAVAERAFGAGQIIEAAAVRQPGPRAGEAVKVVLISGTLSIEQTGRTVPCARNHNCAVLPSGKHVDGAFVDGRLLVQLP